MEHRITWPSTPLPSSTAEETWPKNDKKNHVGRLVVTAPPFQARRHFCKNAIQRGWYPPKDVTNGFPFVNGGGPLLIQGMPGTGLASGAPLQPRPAGTSGPLNALPKDFLTRLNTLPGESVNFDGCAPGFCSPGPSPDRGGCATGCMPFGTASLIGTYLAFHFTESPHRSAARTKSSPFTQRIRSGCTRRGISIGLHLLVSLSRPLSLSARTCTRSVWGREV